MNAGFDIYIKIFVIHIIYLSDMLLKYISIYVACLPIQQSVMFMFHSGVVWFDRPYNKLFQNESDVGFQCAIHYRE